MVMTMKVSEASSLFSETYRLKSSSFWRMVSCIAIMLLTQFPPSIISCSEIRQRLVPSFTGSSSSLPEGFNSE